MHIVNMYAISEGKGRVQIECKIINYVNNWVSAGSLFSLGLSCDVVSVYFLYMYMFHFLWIRIVLVITGRTILQMQPQQKLFSG